MANLYNLFNEYNQIIKLSDSKRKELIIVRDNLRMRIQKRNTQFGTVIKPYKKLEFQSQ